jgi:hypothetical protein
VTHLDTPLIAEAAKRTSVCWVRAADATRPVWHVWDGEAVLVVVGGDEQPFGVIDVPAEVEVTLHSADTRARLATWAGSADILAPGSPEWEAAAALLVAAAQNTTDRVARVEAWRTGSRLLRIAPHPATPHTG